MERKSYESSFKFLIHEERHFSFSFGLINIIIIGNM
jgi:hypothetical protein